jgi:putative zinc finger/helix-turn-helix YgiT family protein
MKQLTGAQVPMEDFECPSCGSHDVASSNESETFEYGEKNPVKLTVELTVHSCGNCGMSYTTEDASDIRHNEVCRYLGVLSPTEIRSVRERHGLSQAQFAEITKLGKASLARWEGGQLIQTQANDNLLFLLTFSENLRRLQERTERKEAQATKQQSGNVLPFRPKLRAISSSEFNSVRAEGEKFELFPAQIG